MGRLKEFIRRYNYNMLIAILALIWSFIVEPKEWILDSTNKIVLYIFGKSLLIVLVLVIVTIAIKLKQIAKNDKVLVRNTAILGGTLIVVYSFFLLLVTPGVYNTDGIYIYTLTRLLRKGATSQGLFTVLINLVAMNIWPSPVTVLEIQIILCTIFYIALYWKVRRIFKTEWSMLVFVPAFLPSVVFYTLVPMRAILFGMLFCLTMMKVLEIYVGVKRGNFISRYNYIVLSLETAMLCIWRFEVFPLALIIPIIVGILAKKNFIKDVLIMMIYIGGIFMVFKLPVLLDNPSGMELSGRIMMINPLSCMLQKDLKGARLEENLAVVDQFLSIENLMKHPNPASDAIAYEVPGTLKYDTEESIINGLIAYSDIVIHNLSDFISVRMETFKITEKDVFVFLPYEEYSVGKIIKSAYIENSSALEISAIEKTVQQMQPLFPEIRIPFLNALYKYKFFWINTPWIIGLVLSTLIAWLLNRNRNIILCLFGILIMYAALIWATIPNTWYMYWLPSQLLAYEFMMICIVYCMKVKKQIKTERKKT